MLTDTKAALGTTWVVDPECSTVGFNIAHFGVATVKGRFGTFAGTLGTHRGVVWAGGTVDPATVDTGNALRDRGCAAPSTSTSAAIPRSASPHGGSNASAPTRSGSPES